METYDANMGPGRPGDSRDNVMSRYWYVFIVMSEDAEGQQSGYSVSLNKNWFTKEDAISLARSIKCKK